MKFLAGFVSTLLVLALIQTGFSLVLDHTVLNAHYLEAQAAKTHFYDNLAATLPDQIATTSDGTTADEATIKQKLATIITPAAIRAHVEPALVQVEAFYKGKSTKPATINLSDLADQARAAGLDIPADQFNKQVVLTPTGSPAKSAVHQLEAAKTIGLIATGLLFAALVVLVFYRRKVAPMMTALIIPGVLFALVAVGLLQLPGLVNANFKLNDKAKSLEPTIKQLVNSLSHGLSLWFFYAAVILGLVAAVIFAAHWFAGRRGGENPTPSKPTAAKPSSATKKP